MVDTTISKISSGSKPSRIVYGSLGSKYFLIKKIGKGVSSTVYLAEKANSPMKEQLAIKICKKSFNPQIFNEESNLMKKIPYCPHIIKYFETGKDTLVKKKTTKNRSVYYHVFEYAENNILFNYINTKEKKGFGEKYGRILFNQILIALEQCHKNGIAHKDLKPENLLLSSDYQIKLSDFGFATETNNSLNKFSKFSTFGTNGFFPPEVYSSGNLKSIDPIQCDFFALGVTLFVIVCGYKPFGAAKRSDNHYKKIMRKNYEKYWNELPFKTIELSKEFKDFIMKFFSANIKERFISFEEIRSAQWMNESDWTNTNDRNMLKAEFEMRKKKIDFDIF